MNLLEKLRFTSTSRENFVPSFWDIGIEQSFTDIGIEQSFTAEPPFHVYWQQQQQ